jgi:hypothetical protein
MPTVITPKITPQGVLIPREAMQGWLEQGIEIVKHENQIIIQPLIEDRASERERVLKILDASGLLVKLASKPLSPPVTPEEREVLAEKFSVGRPLSEIIIEERAEQ